MKYISSRNWKLSLTLSALAILLATLTREGFISSDMFKQGEKQVSEVKRTNTVEASGPEEHKVSESDATPSAGQKSEVGNSSVDNGVSAKYNHERPSEILKTELIRNLSEAGFTSHEAEIATTTVLKTFEDNAASGGDNIALALDNAVKALGMNEARKDTLRKALFDAFSETGGSFSADEFRDCMNRRVINLKVNSCSQELAEQFTHEILGAAQGFGRVTLQMQKQYAQDIRPKFVQRSEACKLDRELAEKLFAPMLSDCPR